MCVDAILTSWVGWAAVRLCFCVCCAYCEECVLICPGLHYSSIYLTWSTYWKAAQMLFAHHLKKYCSQCLTNYVPGLACSIGTTFFKPDDLFLFSRSFLHQFQDLLAQIYDGYGNQYYHHNIRSKLASTCQCSNYYIYAKLKTRECRWTVQKYCLFYHWTDMCLCSAVPEVHTQKSYICPGGYFVVQCWI